MDYEKKYNEALGQAKFYHGNCPSEPERKKLEKIFPELAESEDERIRRTLIGLITWASSYSASGITTDEAKEMIDWLEKQGEQKSVNWNKLTWEDINDLEAIMNEVHSDFRNGIGQKSFGLEVLERFLYNKDCEDLNVKSPKFKDGDEIRSIDGQYKDTVLEVLSDGSYRLKNLGLLSIPENQWELVNAPVNGYELIDKKEQNAHRSWYMEGYHDREFNNEPRWVIKTGEGGPRYEENPKYGQIIEQKPKFYPGDVIKCTSTGSLWVRCKGGDNIKSDGHTACIGGGFELASKEETMQFFHELTENGYQWDCIKGSPIKKEQKPAEWDDYTKTNLGRAIQIIKDARGTLHGYQTDDGIYECDKAIEALEHFLYRGLEIEKSADWSEEDEEMLNSCICSIEESKENRYAYKETDGDTSYDHEIAWLKSLRPSWKPSEDEERLINTSISFLKDFADKGYENAVECIDWLKSKLNGNTCK